MEESSTEKSRLTDEEIREYAMELFLGSLPKLKGEKESEKKESTKQHKTNNFDGKR